MLVGIKHKQSVNYDTLNGDVIAIATSETQNRLLAWYWGRLS